MGNASGELSALRVVNCTSSIAGAYCAKLFADAGSDVIVAEPAVGHPLRAADALFRYLHHGQRSIVGTDPTTFADADIVFVEAAHARGLAAVSYTHLTLPTKRIV